MNIRDALEKVADLRVRGGRRQRVANLERFLHTQFVILDTPLGLERAVRALDFGRHRQFVEFNPAGNLMRIMSVRKSASSLIGAVRWFEATKYSPPEVSRPGRT